MKPSWFSHGVQWDADISCIYKNTKIRRNLTIFSSDDRDDASAEVFKDASRYGFTHVNINHLARIS